MEKEKIIVLDFGGQYAHLLARRVRDNGVYSEIMNPTAPSEDLKKAKGIILSGGPQSVYDEDAIAFNPEIFSLGVPILGLCYGQQLIANSLEGKVEQGKIKEYGSAKIKTKKSVLFDGLASEFTVWMSHGDKVSVLPPGFSGIGSTNDCNFAAIACPEKKIFGLQFHPEVTHTQNGLKIIENFLFKICKCEKKWSMKDYLEQKIEEIKKEAGDKNVFLLLSGGVDSTVCLALLDKALGSERIHALHVDTGFMRKNESTFVKKELEKLGVSKVHVLNAEESFLEKLKGVIEPEEKRNIIGQHFIDLAVEELTNLNFDTENWLIGQGTIYPDTIETGGTEHAKKIKTHHNRAPVILKMIEEGMVIEPLKQLYKDEVRALGKLLGLPENLVERHPFPGPGLAIRILCSKGVENANKELEEKINSEIKSTGYTAKVLPIKAVGVQGDNRTYSNAVVVEGELDYEKLEELSTKITNAFSSINRVVFAINKIDSLELEEAYLTKERATKLQEADAIVMNTIEKKGLMQKIWQFPVVLLPINFNSKGEGIVLRPVYSKEAMTAKFAKIDKPILEEMVKEIISTPGIGTVLLDITHKPPATIEWE